MRLKNTMIAIIRLRSIITQPRSKKKLLEYFSLKRINSCRVFTETIFKESVAKKLIGLVIWGSISNDIYEKLLKFEKQKNTFYLHPIRGGFNVIKKRKLGHITNMDIVLEKMMYCMNLNEKKN